jgi:hypothetical protein
VPEHGVDSGGVFFVGPEDGGGGGLGVAAQVEFECKV